MRLVRCGQPGQEVPGLIDANGIMRDLSGHVDDIDGRILDDASLARLRNLDPASLPEIDRQKRLGPCVAHVGKFLCIGLNFHDHATETGLPIPAHPILFMKATSSISGPHDDIVRPRNATQIDWEVELGVVIGKPAKYVTEDEALDYVAGYCVVNDLSERYFQMHLTGQWTKGKSCDGFGPVGPYLLTRDEVSDPQNLDMSVTVNGTTMQNGNSRDMIFSVRQIIAHLSDLMTLHPGDIIATGTPAGVGMGQKPDPVYLQDGDEIVTTIAGLGSQRQFVVAES
jgi:2-keto-4-pentenoate hydratase/2-oxohepta-3-ene-1,7-dioic acid hydratase in catechol pathway